jgi:hypothetical protein
MGITESPDVPASDLNREQSDRQIVGQYEQARCQHKPQSNSNQGAQDSSHPESNTACCATHVRIRLTDLELRPTLYVVVRFAILC